MEIETMITIQLIAILIALAALHSTYLYYKRESFTKSEVLFWVLIWIGFILVTAFPRMLSPVVGQLGLQRSMDLIMIIAFIILFGLTFHNYMINHRAERRLEKLIRSLALHELDKEGTKEKKSHE
jgi:hypothetical protein